MASRKFRDLFTFASKDTTHWFPGHMALGLKQMQQKLKNVDCIIEVHDARIPFSGRNPNFYPLLSAVRPLVLVLNKMDLADLNNQAKIAENLKQEKGIRKVIFTNCKQQDNKGLKQIFPTVIELIQNSERYNRKYNQEFTVMVIGVPNVGKSSLINQLRGRHLHKAKATRVGASPGVTRAVLEKIKLSDDPLVYILDTPGVLAPNIKTTEIGMRLALCAILKDSLVGEDVIADYLLYWLNKNNNFSYVKILELDAPNDNIQEVLLHIAVKFNKYRKIRTPEGIVVMRPNFQAAASYMIKIFREGGFGPVMLDGDILEETKNTLRVNR